jgi:CRISPR type I-D-associated protein Csc2
VFFITENPFLLLRGTYIMKRFEPFLGSIDKLLDESPKSDKGTYFHPALKNLGCVSLVLIREAIAPVIFRNSEPEITDIDIAEEPHVRAVPNKFKYPERSRGLQILRLFKVGGKMAQNKTLLSSKQAPSEAFDLNTLVFGDSANQDNRVLPVKAAVNYSDALSVLPKHFCVDESFHNRAMEDGTLWDAEDKKNSDNLFTRHFIRPGTLLIQVLSTRGKLLPPIGLDHLLLSLGVAGAYGGQTSVTGVNVQTHLVGIYAGRFEQPVTSPYVLVKQLNLKTDEDPRGTEVEKLIPALHEMLVPVHEEVMDHQATQKYQQDLIKRFEQDHKALATEYQDAAKKVAHFFDEWFGK